LPAVTARPVAQPSDSAGRGTGELTPEPNSPNGSDSASPLPEENGKEKGVTASLFAAGRDAFLIRPDPFLDAYFAADVEPLYPIVNDSSSSALTSADQTPDESVDSLAMYAALAVTLGGFRWRREKEKVFGTNLMVVGVG
jgi:hypothetical protein